MCELMNISLSKNSDEAPLANHVKNTLLMEYDVKITVEYYPICDYHWMHPNLNNRFSYQQNITLFRSITMFCGIDNYVEYS